MNQRFRELAEDIVKMVYQQPSELDAIEVVQHELEVYYEEEVTRTDRDE